MKQMKKFLLAFFIPTFIFLVGYYSLGYTIKGENYIISDMQGQYVSLFSYLRDVLHESESLFYSFQKGMGGSMFAAFAYYLSSPFNILLLFVNQANIPIFIFILILFKIGLSGGTMHLYLEKHYKIDEKMAYLFSTSYALMGYVIQYYFNIMWLDAIYLLPLVLLAIDRLIDQNKKGFYIFVLFFTIMSNFYTGYMICIFSFLYFMVQMSLQNKKIFSKTTFHFLICSLLAALLSTGLILPTIIELKNIYRFPNENIWNISTIMGNLKVLLSKLYIGAHNCKNVLNSNGTNLYCGTFILLFTYLYFTNTDISFKKKMLWGGLLTFLVISSIFPILIYLWHGFSFPHYFMNRNSFLLTFVLILLAFESYNQLGVIPYKKLLPLLLLFGVTSLVVYFEHYAYLHLQEIILTGGFLFIYILILGRLKKDKYFKVLFLSIAVIEILINFQFTFQGTIDNITLDTIVTQYEELDFDSNYRAGNRLAYSGLDSMLAKTPTLTSFISTGTRKVHEFMKGVGYPSSGVAQFDINQNTLVVDSLLGMRDYLSTNQSIGYEPMKQIKWLKKDATLYQNPYALPIGYLIDHNPILLDSRNAFRYQNDLMKSFSGMAENPLELVVESKLQEGQTEILVAPGNYYVQLHYIGNIDKLDQADVIVNGRNLNDWEVYGVFQVINVEDSITLTIPKIDGVTVEGISIYKLNSEVFQKQIETLQKNTLKNIQRDKNKLLGKIEVNEKKILFLSIPYEDGWKVKVDGKKINKIEIANTFLGIELDIGMHEIELEYIPKGIHIGIFTTLTTILITIFYLVCVKKE